MGEKKRKQKALAASGGATGPGPAPREEPGASVDGTGAPREIPLSAAPLPLRLLEADWLGGFLELCFPDQQLVALCRELRMTAPGYRLESMPPEQIARMLADEYLAADDVREPIETAIREVLRTPMFEGRSIPKEQLGDALEDVLDVMLTGDPLQQLARVSWAALLEPEHAMRAAKSAIDEGLRALEAPQRPAKKKATLEEKEVRRELEQAARTVEEAKKRAERAERERDSLQRQLADQRAETASRDTLLRDERAESQKLRHEQTQLRSEVSRLSSAGEGRALSDLRRAEAESRGLSERLSRAEEAKTLAESRVALLEKQLAANASGAAAPAKAESEELPSEEEAQTFLLPVFTREFYDSIVGFPRRTQRAAFDKIHRLAGDWRHPSLRALALEGLPGHYRIRVAIDVRLIYRRDGNQLEILSLIDREDLDRYIRLARTR